MPVKHNHPKSGQFSTRIISAIAVSLFLNLIMVSGIFAQANERLKPNVGTATRFDVSPPLRSITPVTSTKKSEKGIDDRGNTGPVNNTIHDTDPVVQRWHGEGIFNRKNTEAIPPTGVSYDGLFQASGPTPPDTVGDVGPNHYVQMVNSRFQVFNKMTGASVFGPVNINTLWAGFGGPCQTQNAGDPVVLHDQMADRWMITQFTSTGPTYFNCVALSTTSDPTGSYYRWAFTTGTNFPDYPKYGIWSDGYYISTREFAGGSTYTGVGAYALNRDQMLLGNPSPQVVSFFFARGSEPFKVGDGLLPADLDGNTLPPAGSPNYYVGSMDAGGPYGAPADALNLFKFKVDWTTPANSTFTLTNQINIAAFDTVFPCITSARACIPQPGTTAQLDILSYRQRPLHRLAYRNFGTHESLVTTSSVEAVTGIAGMRWWEIRSPNSSPVIFQEGTYSPDNVHRWMGSIAQDRLGNMLLGFSVSDSTTVFPGIRYTGRLVTDPLGTMPQGEGTIVNGTGSQTSTGNRWGDYSSMNVDPTNDCTFWYTNEYYATTSSSGWRTRIGSVTFPNCLAPTGTNVSISGRVTSAFGLGVSGAIVKIQPTGDGPARTTRTSSLGYYKFDNVLTGENYIISIKSRRYSFASRVIFPTGNMTDVDFVEETSSSLKKKENKRSTGGR